MSDSRISELRLENSRLKEQVEKLEDKILSLVGNIEFQISGIGSNKGLINEDILTLFNETRQKINIVSPKIDRFYTNELKRLSDNGIEVKIVLKDRSLISPDYIPFFDELKASEKITMVTNPNIKNLVIFNERRGLYAGMALDKDELEKTTLIETKVNDTSKLGKLKQLFDNYLPSFMR